MMKVLDHDNRHVGWSWYCSWCHRCGPMNSDKEASITEYLKHQDSRECVEAEEVYDVMMAEANEMTALYLDMLPKK